MKRTRLKITHRIRMCLMPKIIAGVLKNNNNNNTNETMYILIKNMHINGIQMVWISHIINVFEQNEQKKINKQTWRILMEWSSAHNVIDNLLYCYTLHIWMLIWPTGWNTKRCKKRSAWRWFTLRLFTVLYWYWLYNTFISFCFFFFNFNVHISL